MTKRKSFNPFKMWGAWVGAILVLILAVIGEIFDVKLLTERGLYFMFIQVPIELLSFGAIGSGNIGTDVSLIVFIGIVYGFLIGWGIHSIFRGIRK